MPSFSQTTSQQQTQQQVLSPQQLLLSHLTELPIEALHERVDQELADNVSLERAATSSGDDYGSDASSSDDAAGESDAYDADELGDVSSFAADSSQDDDSLPVAMVTRGDSGATASDTLSFYDQLEQQIGYYHLTAREEEIMRYIIGMLDKDGLLRVPLQQLCDELQVYHNVDTSTDEVERVLGVLQNFEPAGVGAQTLQQCLLLQVDHGPRPASPQKQLLRQLLTEHFDTLMHKRWDRIQRSMRLTDAQVHMLQREVRRLNPRPGSSMGEAVGRNLQQITPDFLVETDPYGSLSVTLNNGHVPPLRVSDDDVAFLQSYEGRDLRSLPPSERDGVVYLRERVERARSFIEALRQRRLTLLSTMRAIVAMQRPFFESGDETLLRPMTLDDVARRTGLHLSTVSRVSNSKWVETSWGIYPLKWFFTSAARLDGTDVSVRSIKAALQEIVDGEDPRRPLSDDALTAALRSRGYDVARRTVAKYRDSLGIAKASLRRGT